MQYIPTCLMSACRPIHNFSDFSSRTYSAPHACHMLFRRLLLHIGFSLEALDHVHKPCRCFCRSIGVSSEYLDLLSTFCPWHRAHAHLYVRNRGSPSYGESARRPRGHRLERGNAECCKWHFLCRLKISDDTWYTVYIVLFYMTLARQTKTWMSS